VTENTGISVFRRGDSVQVYEFFHSRDLTAYDNVIGWCVLISCRLWELGHSRPV